MLLVYEVIGNDICSRNKNFDSMTTPEVFEEETRKHLATLD